MMHHTIVLDGESLTVENLWQAARTAQTPGANLEIRLSEGAQANVLRAAEFLKQLANSGRTVYGINTGFGYFANTRIAPKDIEKLQHNIILSHACGVGEALPRDLVMGLWVILLNSMCRGHRGIRLEVIEAIVHSLKHGVLSIVPARGSVGASGDLAPTAHAVLPLLGEGMCSMPEGEGFVTLPATEALQRIGLSPVVLGAKEGLSLINGTQLTAAMAVKLWHETKQLVQTANLTLSLMVEGLRASHAFFGESIIREQRHPATAAIAEQIRLWIPGKTSISESHSDCGRVQDPYSVRCAPQVHGMVWQELEQTRDILNREINATTDNPCLFPAEESVVHGGNFHAIYPARVCDRLAAAMATLAQISERRIHMAMKQDKSGLPNFLIAEGGLNSGFMMAQTTAAALASECKTLSFPASVDSISTNNDQEDHVSMGPIAGWKALQVAKNLRYILAIELLSAAQAVDLLRPLRTSDRLEAAIAILRQHLPMLTEDRILATDMEIAAELIASEVLLSV